MTKVSDTLTIALTGFGGLDNPGPGIGVARCLRDHWGRKVKLHALVYETWETGAWSEGLVDELHVIPPIAGGASPYIQRILSLHKKIGFDYLLPNLDLEMPVISRESANLRRVGLNHNVASDRTIASVTKARLAKTCYEHGILTPTSLHASELDDVPQLARQLGYPVVVKGTVAGAEVVRKPEHAYFAAARYDAIWGGGAILQEFIRGDEYVVGFVSGGRGQLLGAVPMRKTALSGIGKAMTGMVVDEPRLLETARSIVKSLEWEGPGELEFVRSAQNGRYYCIEVNCRFPSWIYLSAFAKCNLPALMVEAAVGGRKRFPRPKTGIGFARNTEETCIHINSLRDLKNHGSAKVSEPLLTKAQRRSSTGVTVALSGVSAQQGVLPGLGTAKSLRHASEVASVVGLAVGPNDTGTFSPALLDRVYLTPPAKEEKPFLERLLAIRKRDGLDLFVPGTDIDTKSAIAIADDLKQAGIATLIPSGKAYARTSKTALFNPSQSYEWKELAVPQTQPIRSKAALEKAIRAFGSRFVIKPALAETMTVHSPSQAREVWGRYRDSGMTTLYAQEFIDGEEYSTTGLCDRNHELVAAFTVKKTCKTSEAKTWGAAPVKSGSVEADLAAFLKHIRWVGPFELEFLRSATNDRPYIVEINPRFSAHVDFGRMIGLNLGRILVQTALGLPLTVDCDSVNENALFIRTTKEHPVTARDLASFVAQGVYRHDTR